MLKNIENGGFYVDPEKLLQREGPICERPFCSMLVFRKGTLSLEKLLLDSILHYLGAYS